MAQPPTQWSQSIAKWLDEQKATSEQPALCDVLIIGSGYGGSFAARELASPQSSVWVMERGREYALGEFPQDIGMLPAHVRLQAQPGSEPIGYHDALLELRRFDSVSVLVANGLGGGSLINAGVALRPSAQVLQQSAWPAHYREDPSGAAALWSAMTEVEAQLQVAPLSDARTLHKFKALDALGQSMGLRAEPAPLTIASDDQMSPAGVAQKACTRCGNCFTGCNVGAKNTMATHVLPDAHRNGARFFTGATALEVLPATQPGLRTPQGRPARWTVRMVCTQGQGRPDIRREFEVHAHTVILGAGALGSTEILLNSPAVPTSRLLGARFSTNGDVMAIGWGMRARVNGMAIPGADTDVLAPPQDRVGPTITGILRVPLTAPGLSARTVLIQEGAIPSALTQLTVAIASTLSLPHRYVGAEGPGYFAPDWSTDRLATPAGIEHHAMLMLGMGADDADGVLSTKTASDGKRHLSIQWPTKGTGPDSPYYQAIHQWMNTATSQPSDGLQGGDYLTNPLWQALPSDFNEITGGAGSKHGVSVHPLGGCAMGDDATHGVVDWRGTVFNPAGGVHAGLHVLDGAMLPTAVGVNPFLTIASLSVVAARSIRASLDEPAAVVPSIPPIHPVPDMARQQARYPAPRKMGGEPVTLRFKEHLMGNWRGPEPEWLPKLSPNLTPQELARAWIVAVEVSLDVGQWVANPSMQLEGATLRIFRNPRPNDITVHPDACQGTPVLEGTGWVSLLALDPPHGRWDQITRIASALQAFLQRRGWGELTGMAASGTPHPGEGRLGSMFRRVRGFLRAARNLSFHRELRYDFELHRPERPQYRVQAQGKKRLAYVPGAKNLWDALVEIDLTLTPHNGQNAATLSLTADLIDMVRNRRLQVAQATNTPAGMAGMMAFGALWLRVIFQTHFWTFRGLDYAQLKPPPPAQHGLMRGALAPERFVLPVPRYADTARGQDMLELELTRYTPASRAPGSARHLLLVHGLAHGGTVFTTATNDGNNMAAAFVEAGYTVWVMDHRLSNRLPYSNNDHCMDDVAQLDIPAAVRHVYAAAGAPVAVFAHCVGGGAFAMATLKGWLMDPDIQRSMVDSAIIHAVHPWVVPSPSNQLSGSLGILYKDFLPDRMSIDPVPPASQGGALDQVLDRLGASLPWPESDSALHLKDQFDPLAGTATCNRMTLFYGREWVHANLNPATHRELASLVGPASLEVFRQLFFIVNRQRLTDRDGASVYMTAPQFQAHWTFPILFAHGSANAVFDPRSAVRSWGRLQKLQPERVVRLFKAEGYGHMDFLFGQHAHRDVYPYLCNFLSNPAAFESSWGADHDPHHVPHHWRDADDAATRRPLVGPTIRLAETTVDHSVRRQLVLWTEFPNDPTQTAPVPSLCDAQGITLGDWSATRLKQVHLNPALDRKTTLLQGPGAYWTGRLTESSPGAFQDLDELHLSWGEQGALGHAHLALAHLHWFKRWTGVPVPEPVSWLALSCRWPGTPFESEAVDAVALQMQYHVTRSSLPVDALVMLGDQIYADATANMMKTRETDEVLAGMYRDAWGGPHTRALLASVPSYTVVDDHEYGDNWCGCADVTQDAAFINGFEAAMAYQWRWSDGPAPKYQSAPSVDVAEVTGFWNAFQVGGVPFFAADTRSERQLRSPSNWRTRAMVGTAQMTALKTWLMEHKDVPKVLCSGSVMGFVERDLYEAPGKCLVADSWSGYPATWRELVRFIVAEQIKHLIFLSGDYHFSGISELELHAEGGGAPVRALSVACSGWNATLPFANAMPQDFVMGHAVNYPQSDTAVRLRCTTRAMSTAHRQFSKLTLTQDAHGAWCLTVRVFDEHGDRKDLVSQNF